MRLRHVSVRRVWVRRQCQSKRMTNCLLFTFFYCPSRSMNNSSGEVQRTSVIVEISFRFVNELCCFAEWPSLGSIEWKFVLATVVQESPPFRSWTSTRWIPKRALDQSRLLKQSNWRNFIHNKGKLKLKKFRRIWLFGVAESAAICDLALHLKCAIHRWTNRSLLNIV